MLELDETLFVEHKSDIGTDTVYKLVQAVAAFANTLGGWLLIGVHNGKLVGDDAAWAGAGPPTLVDMVRDRLRGEIDPLPTFEAKVIAHPDGPIGVVRVYESSDTPHVSLRSGAVFVREVAGVADANDDGKAGAGKRGQRIYQATQIRSRAQLLELAARGRLAAERVDGLVNPARPLPLIKDGLGLGFGPTGTPLPTGRSMVFVRLVPYTLPPRFRGWATTAEASAAVLSGAEGLAQRRGLDNSWKIPDPAGVAIHVPLEPGARHRDAGDRGLDAFARVVVDGAGLAAAALELAGPENEGSRPWVQPNGLAHDLIAPTIQAAADVLAASEILGRVWCQIDLVGLASTMLIEGGGNQTPRFWVPTGADLTLPVDDAQLGILAERAANAYARGAGIPAWDPPGAA